jgi:dolichyl-phosphate-mannose-protein mannosyltransferase
MAADDRNADSVLIGTISSVLIVNAFLFLLWRDQTFVHIDAIAHVNKARGIFDNLTPGLRQLGTVWLPLPHLLILPFAWVDVLWRNGAAGSLVSLLCYIGTSIFLFRTGYAWTGSRMAGWMAFLLFALNPRLIYLFTTPENEPLMVLCATGLLYYMVQWTEDQSWKTFAMAALMAFAGTLTRYEGWALAAAMVVLVPTLARKQRMASTILFMGAAVAGPVLWMLFNMVYFDDPLMFAYGIGSAQDYASSRSFPTAGKWWDSAVTYFIDVAYCVNPAVLWLGVAGVALSLMLIGRRYWRPTLVLVAGSGALFAFYILNLYANIVPVIMPGMLENDPQATINVRYGSVMASTIVLFAALFVFFVIRQVDRHRAYSLFLLAPLFLPDPIPAPSSEPIYQQFTRNLFYTEAIHNQSFWMPPFVEVSEKLKADMEARRDGNSLVMTNTRIVHVVVWATGIPIRRFLHEMNKGVYNLNNLDPKVRWVITEEGDQLWHAQGKFLQRNFIEVASAKTPATRVVHLYRRPD